MIVKSIKAALALCVALYAAAIGVMWVDQVNQIFDQKTVAADYDWGFSEGVEEIQLERPDGLVYGAYHPSENPGDAVVIFFHGNNQNLSASPRMADLFARLGYDLLAAERRLAGKSYGPLTEKTLFSDAAAWYDYARSRWPESDIRVVGYSMGTASATALAAARPDVKDVVLFAPFSSLSYMAKYRTWWAPDVLLDAVLDFPLRNDLNMARADQARFRVYHGTADPTVPYVSGKKLEQAFNEDDAFFTVDGADHWSIIWDDDTFADLKSAWGR